MELCDGIMQKLKWSKWKTRGQIRKWGHGGSYRLRSEMMMISVMMANCLLSTYLLNKYYQLSPPNPISPSYIVIEFSVRYQLRPKISLTRF